MGKNNRVRIELKIMTNRIVFFSNRKIDHQAGAIYRMGSDLAAAGKTVILVDTNPQCHLTLHALMKTAGSETAIADILSLHPNIKTGMDLESDGVNCYKLDNRLWLLVGDISFAEYESAPIRGLTRLITNLLDATAKRYDADYLLIDTAPTLGRINQSVVMISDYLVIPLSKTLDVLSRHALGSLVKMLTRWIDWAKVYTYDGQNPFPGVKWLGMLPVDEMAISDDVTDTIKSHLIPEFKKYDMILTLEQAYTIQAFMRVAKNNLGV